MTESRVTRNQMPFIRANGVETQLVRTAREKKEDMLCDPYARFTVSPADFQILYVLAIVGCKNFQELDHFLSLFNRTYGRQEADRSLENVRTVAAWVQPKDPKSIEWVESLGSSSSLENLYRELEEFWLVPDLPHKRSYAAVEMSEMKGPEALACDRCREVFRGDHLVENWASHMLACNPRVCAFLIARKTMLITVQEGSPATCTMCPQQFGGRARFKLIIEHVRVVHHPSLAGVTSAAVHIEPRNQYPTLPPLPRGPRKA
jgi:hypothetical protein